MPILAQVREHVETGLTDDALGRLIADATEEVEGRWGTDVERTVVLECYSHRLLRLFRPALSIASITEQRSPYSTGVLLVLDTDYSMRPGGRLVERMVTTWGERVTVVYTPIPEISLRDRMVIDLVQLAVQYSALSKEVIGDYTSEQGNYTEARERILAGAANRRGLRFT
jgi:hypothetical protein